jgi:hypothetical protein
LRGTCEAAAARGGFKRAQRVQGRQAARHEGPPQG